MTNYKPLKLLSPWVHREYWELQLHAIKCLHCIIKERRYLDQLGKHRNNRFANWSRVYVAEDPAGTLDLVTYPPHIYHQDYDLMQQETPGAPSHRKACDLMRHSADCMPELFTRLGFKRVCRKVHMLWWSTFDFCSKATVKSVVNMLITERAH